MKIAIYGYGNLGRGVELAARQNKDMEMVGVFTRRAPESVKTLTGIPVYSVSTWSTALIPTLRSPSTLKTWTALLPKRITQL